MSREPRLIRSINDLRRNYRQLGAGDVIIGVLALRPGEEIKVLDLAERGVVFFPPVLAQLLGRSKVAQAEVLGEYMVPGSFVAYALADLAGKLPEFQAREAVVAKRDRAHLGLGVSLWPSLETLYSLAGLQGLTYPLVVQPFLDGARDLRVVAWPTTSRPMNGSTRTAFARTSFREDHLNPPPSPRISRIFAGK